MGTQLQLAGVTLVPTFTFGPTGFVAPTGPAVLAGVQGDINAAFGNTLNYDIRTPQGQLSQSWAAIIENTYATFQNLTQQMDPAYSSGRMQDGIARIYSLQRNPSQPTVLQISCSGGTGVAIPFGALIQDQAKNLYSCTLAGTIPAAGSITLPFAAVIPGPTTVPAQNSVSIYTIISGWDSVAVVSGIQGVNTEGRAALEIRRQDSVAGNSLGQIGSIIGAVAQVPGVVDYWGYNNNTASPVTISGVTVAANAMWITVAGGVPLAVAQAILSKKGGGAPMGGNTTVTAYDNNPLYASPIPYSITFQIPTTIQMLVNVVIVNNPLIPSNYATLVQNAVVAAMTGQSTMTPAPPKVRIATTVFAANYVSSVAALGSWAQISSLTVGSINTNPATFAGNISSNTLTVTGTVTGTIAIGQAVFDQDARVSNGTYIVSGSGTSWTVNQPQTVAGATSTGNTSGSSVNVTISAVTGLIGLGDVVTGTGVPANTTIVSQTSGTIGGAGVYVFSAAVNLTNIALTMNAVITTAAAASASTSILASQVPQVTQANVVVSHT